MESRFRSILPYTKGNPIIGGKIAKKSIDLAASASRVSRRSILRAVFYPPRRRLRLRLRRRGRRRKFSLYRCNRHVKVNIVWQWAERATFLFRVHTWPARDRRKEESTNYKYNYLQRVQVRSPVLPHYCREPPAMSNREPNDCPFP